MRRRRVGVVLRCGRGVSVALAATAALRPGDNENAGFKTPSRRCSRRSWRASRSTPIITVGDVLSSGYRFEAIPDGIALRTRGQGTRRPVREPRDEQGAVPVQHRGTHRGERRERLRQRAGEPADRQPALGRDPQRLVRRSRAARATSASARTTSRRRRKGSTETSCSRTRRRSTTSSGRQDSWPPAIGDPNEKQVGLVVALDVRTGKHTADLRHGPAQPREHRRHSRLRRPGRHVRRRHVHERPADDPGRRPACRRARGRRSRSSTRTSRRTPTSLLADKGELWAFVSDDSEPSTTTTTSRPARRRA